MPFVKQFAGYHWSCVDARQPSSNVLWDDHGGTISLWHQFRWTYCVDSLFLELLHWWLLHQSSSPHLTPQTINFYLYLSRVYFYSSLPFVTLVIDYYWLFSKCMIPFCAPLGVSLSVHPIYIIECTPKRLRVMVGVTIASCMSFGKFSGQLLGIRWGGRRHGYCAESNWGVRWWWGLNYSSHVDRTVPWCPLCRGGNEYENLHHAPSSENNWKFQYFTFIIISTYHEPKLNMLTSSTKMVKINISISLLRISMLTLIVLAC